jgi:glycosyltransferase involved in cell wall biosynthesis
MYTMDREAHRLALALTRSIERRLARRTDAIIAVSPDERDHITSLGIRPDMVHCVVNGIAATPPIEKSAARGRLGLDGDAVIVGYLGRLSRQKNPRLLLEAFARLMGTGRPAGGDRSLAASAPSGANARLAIAGDGEQEQPLRASARDLGVADRVHWLGHRPADEALPAFDVFALPSNYEGMPYVLLEALAAGLPIVATDVGGARLTVREGENGYIVSRPSSDDFALAMKRLVESADERAAFGAVSRRLAAEFSIDRMVDQTLGVYEQVLPVRALA